MICLSSAGKLIEKMRRQPNGVSMDEAHKVLASRGYMFSRQRGSHCHYINSDGDVISIKKEQPLKAVYVKDILKRISKERE
jgi:predicted RNA binding protein YcfA (HicA-like mRNA interferase family)